mmetsp:Transcript_10331/g.36252  ORF Transcript_10331/g.36252 Transcript_10331/m.36252 type:complete len:399 (-) Transcript_10331:97-1293(-)
MMRGSSKPTTRFQHACLLGRIAMPSRSSRAGDDWRRCRCSSYLGRSRLAWHAQCRYRLSTCTRCNNLAQDGRCTSRPRCCCRTSRASRRFCRARPARTAPGETSDLKTKGAPRSGVARGTSAASRSSMRNTIKEAAREGEHRQVAALQEALRVARTTTVAAERAVLRMMEELNKTCAKLGCTRMELLGSAARALPGSSVAFLRADLFDFGRDVSRTLAELRRAEVEVRGDCQDDVQSTDSVDIRERERQEEELVRLKRENRCKERDYNKALEDLADAHSEIQHRDRELDRALTLARWKSEELARAQGDLHRLGHRFDVDGADLAGGEGASEERSRSEDRRARSVACPGRGRELPTAALERRATVSPARMPQHAEGRHIAAGRQRGSSAVRAHAFDDPG